MRGPFVVFFVLSVGLLFGSDFLSGLLFEKSGGGALERLSFHMHWMGVTQCGASSGNWEPPLLPSGRVLTSEYSNYYPENILESRLTMRAAYLLATGRAGRFSGRVLLDFMNYTTGPVDDFYLQFSPFNKPKLQRLLSLRVGQFLLPFTSRQMTFPYELLRPSYSQTVKYLFMNGMALREPALMGYGNVKFLGLNFNYKGFISNGEYQNAVTDRNERKAFGARGELTLPAKWLRKLKIDKLSVGAAYMDAGRMTLPEEFLPEKVEYIERQRWCFDVRLSGRIFGKRYHLYGCYITGSEDLQWYDNDTGWILERNRGVEGALTELAVWLWENKTIDPKRVPVEDMRWRPYGLALVLWWDTFAVTNYNLFNTTNEYRRPRIIYALGIVWDIRWYVKLQAFLERYDYGRYYSGKYIGIDDFGKWRVSVQLAFVAF